MADNQSLDPELSDMRKRLWLALQKFYMRDSYLLENEICEWAISHRLAVYLEHQFPDWNVDCEYNKDGDDPKLASNQRESKRPDIIIHKRGEEGPNLLAIEIKLKAKIDENDRKKAAEYITGLNYIRAVCISLLDSKAICGWQGENASEQDYSKLIWTGIEDIGYDK